jgi:hypothetical protein
MTTTETTGGDQLSAEDSTYLAELGADGTEDSGAGQAAETTEAGTTPAPEAKPAKTENEHVPLATFLTEKQARKELDKQNREMATKLAELQGKFSILDKLKGAPGEQDQPSGPIDPAEDIFGAVNQLRETIAQRDKREADEKVAREASEKAANENQTFVNSYRADADKFKATAPDYMDAYNHLLTSRAQELMSIGYDDPNSPLLTPDEKQAAAKALHDALTQDEMGIAQLAFSKNKSPAQIIYDLAQKRGYAKKGAAPAPEPGEDRLATIERGQAANKSLSTAGGPGGEQDMTAEQLLSMSLEDFDAWATKNPAKARRIMGG